MKAETLEWVTKAENDFKVATREMGADDPVWDTIAFLCQQCAEKYIKSLLEENNTVPKKTHDLVDLLNQCPQKFPDLELRKPVLRAWGCSVFRPVIPGLRSMR
ncbi:MAG: HEPN domain-containing protein [Chloroflexota bacterium]|nr:HEPN domain-containing protein [Chloroflexota bacterium]